MKVIFILHSPFLGQPYSIGCLVYRSVHDSIMANKTKVITSNVIPPAQELNVLKLAFESSAARKILQRIDKNDIISKYNKACRQKGHVRQVESITKGEPTTPPTTYPTIFQLVRDCSMKPSLDHQYRVKDLLLDNIVVIVLQKFEDYLSREEVNNLAKLNSLYQEMVPYVIWLESLEFGKLQEPRIGYTNQEAIQMSHVDMATAAMINYSLHPGMTIRYIKVDNVGKN
jgi:hypothetical protein